LESLEEVFSLLKENWKAVLAIVYAIVVPLYFLNYTSNLRKALDSSRDSSKEQIKILKDTVDKQKIYYDGLFVQYEIELNNEHTRHDEEVRKIRETQQYQQMLLSQRLQDATEMAKELKERYGLNGY
jgi:hypothetical protein